MPTRTTGGLALSSLAAVWRRGPILVALLSTALLLGLFPSDASAASFSASASLSPTAQYLNDTTGALVTLEVRNSGSVNPIGAVQIRRPDSAWTIVSCPGAPAGWTTTRTASRCRYQSAPGSADDIASGQTRSFTFRATTIAGDENRFGTWPVIVSRSNGFGDPSKLRQAGPTGSGLTTRIFSFEILDAVLTAEPATPGAPCPLGDKSATAASTGNTLVVCGRNRTTTTRTPKAARALLEGTFIAGHGSFISGPVAPSTTSVVLGNWANVTITSSAGSGKTVVARIGSARARRSPLTTLGGYTALNSPPVVTTSSGSTAYTEGDLATAIDGALTVTDADDASLQGAQVRISSGFLSATDALQFTDQLGITGSYVSGTSVLTLTGIASVADYQTALRSITFSTTNDNPTPSRTIEFKVNDGDTDSVAAKSITISPVNDAPLNSVPGATQTVDEDTDLTFNSGNGNLISVSDVDAGSGSIKVSLDVSNGILTLSGTAGLVFVDATANGSGSVHVTGSQTAINAALDGLTYRGNLHYNVSRGAEALTILTNDQGNTGTPSALSDSDIVGVSVTATFDPGGISLAVEPFASGFNALIFVTNAGDGSNLLYAVEQRGSIGVISADGEAQSARFLDIAGRVLSGGEQGLLGLAFHPDYAANGRLFVNYTNTAGDTVVSEFTRLTSTPGNVLADSGSERILLVIHQPFANHNGGMIAFGADGYLYIGMGDGGSGGDPLGNGQSMTTLLGKMLRLDVDSGDPYGIPADNPLAGTAYPEIWDVGLRNPWRFSFDRLSSGLFIGDVGQGAWEEVDVEPAGAGGRNYGWNIMEGDQCYVVVNCDQSGLTLPVVAYSHVGNCSVIGGYVYRGEQFPALYGGYVFSDLCSGHLWVLDADAALATGQTPMTLLGESNLIPTSFGEDEAGELYVVNLSGEIYRLVALAN